jgi:hypothetical protein
MTADDALALWTVYDHPSDFPDRFVARLSLISRTGTVVTNETVSAATLEELRDRLPPGLHRLDRDPSDDPVIVETWL